MTISAYVFDAYGTLFDVHAAVRKHAGALGPDADRLSDIWRAKQLEYSWIRGMIGAYKDFWTLTGEALDFAFSMVPSADTSLRQELLDAYWRLDCFAEVPAVLETLRQRGARLAILSNGSTKMLEAAVASAGLDTIFDAVLSVDRVSTFKTNRPVYQLVEKEFALPAAKMSYQSSNRWDVAAAAEHGFRCVWINRSGQPDEYREFAPAVVLKDLQALADLDAPA